MDECVQMWTRNYGALDQTARVCFGVLCANRTREIKRDFCDLPIRGDEGRVVNTPLLFKRVLFQGKKEVGEEEREESPGRENGRKERTRKSGREGKETEKERERDESRRRKKRVCERESEARLEWRKGLSQGIGVKKTTNAGGVENGNMN
ncbi:hypothetical protein TNCV_4775331 [Trichonephila clavipes]|nr:hypothetical protein TNCV_4775331 [Trichonephila clavipes]